MTKIKITALCLVVLLLAGCTALDSARSGIATQGAEVSDRALVDATWVICRAVSIGAWLRAFGNDRQKADAWKTLCSEPVTHTPGVTP
jgi:hypothetical protein